MSNTGGDSLENALLILQRPSASVDDKLNSLRFLKVFIKSETMIPSELVRRINQLVLNSVMELILKEDRVVDPRKKQLIKAECFVLLADLLQTQSMFGSVTVKSDPYDNVVRSKEEIEELNAAPAHGGDSTIAVGRKTVTIGSSLMRSSSTSVISKSRTVTGIRNRVSSADGVSKPDASPPESPQKAATVQLESPSAPGTASSSTPDRASTSMTPGQSVRSPLKPGERTGENVLSDLTFLSTVKDTKLRAVDQIRRKAKKVRPTIFVGSEYAEERLYPGVKSTDWIEQDKKLGYQVSRTWFPVPGIGIGAEMVPKTRSVGEPMEPANIVQEYMQMKSMMSYVGDMVLPFNRSKGIGRPAQANLPPEQQSGVDQQSFEKAMAAAVKVWSPLVGIHTPAWVDAGQFVHKVAPPSPLNRFNDAGKMGFDDDGPVEASKNSRKRKQSELLLEFYRGKTNQKGTSRRTAAAAEGELAFRDLPGEAPDDLKNQVLFSKGALRKLLRNELFLKRKSHDTLTETVNLLANKHELPSRRAIKQQQTKMDNALAEEKKAVVDSAASIQQLMSAEIDLQYALLPPRYLLVVEGTEATSREIIMKGLRLFCRIRSRNLLALAFGVWKIMNIEEQSIARRPEYATTAAVILMHGWLQNRKTKTRGIWLQRWKKSVTWGIYIERNSAVIPLQTLYRRWRDRRILLRLHKAGHYNGPLSDIYLGSHRKALPYSIPRIMRNTRRMYWLTAIRIQSKWRSHHQYMIYMVHRRYILLIGSICRMWPKYCFFRRLRKYTIIAQKYSRRTVKYKQYRRLRAATIIVQKYVRRFLGLQWIARTLSAKFKAAANPMTGIIFMQCRWREHLAKARVNRIKQYRRLREWAALILQKYWYKLKNAFHTFLLMSCYRFFEDEEKSAEVYFKSMGNFMFARKIGRYYRRRYFKRFVTSVVKVQCWYRGCLGYSQVDVLRKIKWASRKLHHWARGMLKYKHKCVRKIQRLWWKSHRGKLRAHLHYRMRMLDEAADLRRYNRRYKAAARIQGYVHGVWCRRWVRQYKAARRIQRPLRFFLWRKRCRREIAERVTRVVRKWVGNVLGKAVYIRSQQVLKKHSRMVVKPQALARGYIIRNALWRARLFCFKVGMAARTVQRWWRKTDAFANAVLVVVSLKRMENNPFKQCETIGDLLTSMRNATSRYYDSKDPRVGMRPNGLLHRLGLSELAGMFDHKQFPYVSNLRGLTMDKMVKVFLKWQEERHRKDNIKGGAKGKYRPPPIPRDNFAIILDVLRPPLYSTVKKEHRDILSKITAVQEVSTAKDTESIIFNIFQKKFGKSLHRAQNTANSLMTFAFAHYSNYMGFYQALTWAQVEKTVNSLNNAADVRPGVEACRKDLFKPDDAKRWDLDRVTKCQELFTLAAERAKDIVPDGPFADMLSAAMRRLHSYKRKFLYLYNQAQHPVHKKKPVSHPHMGKKQASRKNKPVGGGGMGAKSDSKHGGHEFDQEDHHKPHGVQSKVQTSSVDPVPSSMVTGIITPEQSLDLHFNKFASKEDEPMLEFNVSICRIYSSLFDKWYTAYHGVNGLINKHRSSKLKKFFAKKRINEFLGDKKNAYLAGRQENHVKQIWVKLKRAERIATQMQYIMDEVARKNAEIMAALELVPREGWVEDLDENSCPCWYDTVEDRYKRRLARRHPEDPEIELPPTFSYEMPTYTIVEWRATIRIQKRVRILLEVLARRRQLKEEEKMRQLALQNAKLQKEMKRIRIICTPTIHIRDLNITALLKQAKALEEPKDEKPPPKKPLPGGRRKSAEEAPVIETKKSGSRPHTVAESEEEKPPPKPKLTDEEIMVLVEPSLPWRLRFRANLDVFTGSWVLFKPPKRSETNNPVTEEDEEEDDEDQPEYLVAVITHMHRGGKLCDVKTTDSRKFENIELKKHIFQMNIDIGTSVEAKYRGLSYFYKGKVSQVGKNFQGKTCYGVIYDDGEKEAGLVEAFIRVPGETMDAFLLERERKLKELGIGYRRRLFYKEYSDKRLLDIAERVNSYQEEFSQVWKYMHFRAAPPIKDPNDAQKEEMKLMSNIKMKKESPISLMIAYSHQLDNFRHEVKLQLPYTRGALRFGWIAAHDNKTGKEVYKNMKRCLKARAPPLYSVEEMFWVAKIQSVFRMKLAKNRVAAMMAKLSIPHILSDAIKKYQKIAYVGYKLEGITVLQMLRRSNMWEVADCIESHFKGRPHQLASLTVEAVMKMKATSYETIGVFQQLHVRAMSLFRDWWMRKSEAEKLVDLSLVNYYQGPDDERSVRSCVEDSEEMLLDMFRKAFPTAASRMKSSIGRTIINTCYPHAKLQLENYLKHYSGNPGMAQENVYELLNKPTTHTFVEEKQAYVVLRDAAALIRSLLAYRRLNGLRDVVVTAEKKAELIVKHVEGHKRELASGPESRAAYVLRTEVFLMLTNFIKATLLVQKRIRGFTKAHRWNFLRRARQLSIIIIQRLVRGFVARCRAQFLQLQQLSSWEQLWDDKRASLYYYNTITQQTTYEEPLDCYRPLVRDLRSATLMLSWPHLDLVPNSEEEQQKRRPPVYAKGMNPDEIIGRLQGSMCGVCNIRTASRACMDCEYYPPEVPEFGSTRISPRSLTERGAYAEVHPFCFPCFARTHSTNIGYELHKFCDMETGEVELAGPAEDTGKPAALTLLLKSRPATVEASQELTIIDPETGLTEEETSKRVLLRCCNCDILADRKCLCRLDDAQLGSLVSKLSKLPSNRWVNVLLRADLGSERKISILFQELKGIVLKIGDDDTSTIIDPSANGGLTEQQTVMLTNMLERTRAECDECYCSDCYVDAHANGKRAQHKWLGFRPGAEVCGGCKRSPAELNCRECETAYCNPCSRTFHGMGRKRRHKVTKLLEKLPDPPVDEPEIDPDTGEVVPLKEMSKYERIKRENERKPTFCVLCARRHASVKCEGLNCGVKGGFCNSCFECVHKPACDDRVATYHANIAKQKGPTCLVCGEPADSKCPQCHDFYCSRTWMGNPGCFIKYHNRGNRANHAPVPIDE